MHCLSPYVFPIDKLILDLKFNKQLISAKVLSSLLVQAIYKWYKNATLPQTLIPMPLHIKRLKQRGFNQVAEILRPLAKELNLYIDLKLCTRTVFTTPQASLDRQKRKTNLKLAFKIKKYAAYQHVAIIFNDLLDSEKNGYGSGLYSYFADTYEIFGLILYFNPI